jgi:hypothetical protein
MGFENTKDGWYFKFEEGRLGYIHIDFRLMLDLTDGSSRTSLTIETPCRLKKLNENLLLTPEKTPTVAPILALFNSVVIGVAVKKTGQLKVEFQDGHSLEVDPHEQYEAWQIGCSAGLLICSPGGLVSFFPEKPHST